MQMMNNNTIKGDLVIFALSVFAATMIAFLIPPITPWEYFWKDRILRHTRLSSAAESAPENRLLIVGIDETSFEEIQRRWPWPRDLLAEGIRKIVEGRPALIALDVGLWDKGFSPREDRELAEALSPVPHVLPIKFGVQYLEGMEVSRLFLPLREFRQVNTRLGFVNLAPDSDGFIRDLPLTETFNDETWPSFALAIVREAFPEALERIPQSNVVPTRWVGPPGSIPMVSFSDALYGNVAEGTFQNKVVLIGAMYPESKDSFPTAFYNEGEMYGVEVHAQWVEALRRGAFLQEPHFLVLLSMTLLMFLLLGSAVFFLPIRFFFLSLTVGLVIYGGFLEWQTYTGVLWAATPLLVGFVVLTQSALWSRYLREIRNRQRLIAQFSRYVSPKIVRSILDTEQDLKLGGDRKQVAILFTDIRNFTTLSEKWQPEKVVEMLNQYFKEMCDAVFEFDGTVNKFIGDAVMALFNAPLHQNDAPERAVRTALSMRRRLGAMNSIRIKNGEQPIAIGVGIHYGEVISGNIGSPNQMEYTVIGDAVNTASRIESLCKELKSDILISDEVYRHVQDRLEVVSHPPVQVKGRSIPVVVHSVKEWRGG